MGQCNESDTLYDLLELVIVHRGAETLENTLLQEVNEFREKMQKEKH